MPMTDAPNFGTKFGRRKPCLRYIGPLLRTTSVAPVGRGDLTPPLVHSCSPCRGRALSHPAGMVRFCANSRWFGTLPHRVGADLCVRPDTPLRGTRHGPTHRSAPTDSIGNLQLPQKSGGDRAPPLQKAKATNAQCRFEIYQTFVTLVSRKPKCSE